YPVDERTCELRKMYLPAAARGQGLGKRLLEHALEEAKRLGFSRIELETATVLEDAIRLYRRYGFQQSALKHACDRCNESYFLELSRGENMTQT
ncbi:MAG TPA: GNAT family N-acetyltransferase, partial [Candidatus Eisenbacteria bacterium]|nr:GNAT family N-acetyltransferase [Candidatus Eisenbacteria bacterium]